MIFSNNIEVYLFFFYKFDIVLHLMFLLFVIHIL